MERLTVKRPDGRWAIANNDGANPTEQMLKIPIVIDRLAAYEDTGLNPENMAHWEEFFKAECEGRLLILPCKVGDTVYWLHNGIITECRVHRIQLNRTGLFICLKSKVSHGAFRVDICLGRSVFLTREEAEATLAKDNDVPTKGE